MLIRVVYLPFGPYRKQKIGGIGNNNSLTITAKGIELVPVRLICNKNDCKMIRLIFYFCVIKKIHWNRFYILTVLEL